MIAYLCNGAYEKFLGMLKHSFVRKTALLQAGSVSASLIQAGSGVLIARILQPELFGIYSLAFGLASLATLLVGSGFSDAAASLVGGAYARRDAEAISEALAYFLKIVAAASLVTVVILMALPFISEAFYGDYRIGGYAIIIAIAAMISSSYFSLTSISLQVTGNIRRLSSLMVSDQVVRYGLSLGLLAAGFGIAGAMTGHLLGALIIFFISVLIWRRVSRSDPMIPSLRGLSRRIWRVPFKKYFAFISWVAIDRNLSTVYMSLPIILTGLYVAVEEVTFFKLAFGFVNLSLSFLGPISVISNVEFPRFFEEDRSTVLKKFVKLSLYSSLLSLLITVVAIAVSAPVFRILYGESFLPGARYVAGLLVYGGFYGLGVGLGPMWRALNKVKLSIIINLAVLGAGIPLGLWLIREYGIWGSIAMVTIWLAVSHLVSFLVLVRSLAPNR